MDEVFAAAALLGMPLMAIWAMVVAGNRGRKRWVWFLSGLVFGILAVIAVYIAGHKDGVQTPHKDSGEKVGDRRLLKIVGVGFLIIIGLAIVGSLLPDTEQATTGTRIRTDAPVVPTAIPTRIIWMGTTADGILTDYEDNEILAKQRYANRPLEIHGYAGRPDFAPFTNQRYLIPVHARDELFLFVSLSCELDITPEHEAWVLSLKEGDAITVRGYIRDNMEFGTLELEECAPVS